MGLDPFANPVSHLAVSATTGIAFEDGEFLPADWLATPVANPTGILPVHCEERITT